MIVPAKTAKKPDKDIDAIRRKLLAIVEESSHRLTPGELKKQLLERTFVDGKAVKTAINDLVLSQELTYTYHFGCSFLEKSYEKPTRVSKRVVLKPPGMLYEPASGNIVIDISKGASFGFGDHPTTRMAIQGIETAVFNKPGDINIVDGCALDIGTGSGVLAIAAVLLGMKCAVGIDIDPCARAEAQKNAQLNGLEHRIQILDTRIEDIKGAYSLILVNLRYPTLKRLCPHIAGITRTNGAAVVSGVKSEEVEDLLESFEQEGFQCIWRADEKGWAGMVLNKDKT